jgi:hypothetical protein
MYAVNNIYGKSVAGTHWKYGLRYMAYKVQLAISKLHYMLFDGRPQPFIADILQLFLKLDEANGQFFFELHLFISCDTINIPKQLTLNTVCMRDTPCGGFSLSIR